MGKVDDNKKLKMNTLLQTAFDLFTGKGFAKNNCIRHRESGRSGKGDILSLFQDKYDLRDKLIAYKACQLFDDAHKQLEGTEINSLEEEILFLTDYIIDRFQKQQSLLKFLSKNLSWGVFQDAVGTGSVVSRQFYDHYRNSLVKYNVNCENPDLLLFTLIELISSTSYNCILHEKPVSMEEYKPYLHKSLKKVYEVFVSVQG